MIRPELLWSKELEVQTISYSVQRYFLTVSVSFKGSSSLHILLYCEEDLDMNLLEDNKVQKQSEQSTLFGQCQILVVKWLKICFMYIG